MLPREPRTSTASEVEVFRAIRSGLDDDWTAIHSLGMAVHPHKPWTQIDFVLIGPAGVYCVEVKGGVEITRRGMTWSYRDGRGRIVTRSESPFDQVGGAAAALRQYLVDLDDRMSSTVVGYGVATPFVDFTIAGPDVLPEVVYDANDTDKPFADYVHRLARYWSSRLHRTVEVLDPRGRSRVVQALAGDFELVRGLVGRIEDVDRALVRLTEDQQQVLAGIQNDRVLVRGGAGTGKTLLAIKTALKAAESGRRTLLTCYSRQLGRWLAEETAGVDRLMTTSLHKFMRDTLAQTGRLGNLPPADDDHLMQVEYPLGCMEALLELGLTAGFDQLVVDEAQDLMIPSYLDVFDQLLDGGLGNGRWTMFYDPNQDLFDRLGGSGVNRILMRDPVRYRLTVNCRNTRQIAFEAAMLAGLRPDETLETDGPDVEEIWYRDPTDQRRKVDRAIGRLLSQGVQPSQITVLSPLTLPKSALRDGFHTTPFQLAESSQSSDHKIAYSTIQGFKGLESDVIVLVDVPGITTSEDRYRIYVGATRARAQLLLALPESAREDYESAAVSFGMEVGRTLVERTEL